MVARSPSQSPRDEKTIEFQSLRKAGIARTLRVAWGAGAAGLGRPWDMQKVYRGALIHLQGQYRCGYGLFDSISHSRVLLIGNF